MKEHRIVSSPAAMVLPSESSLFLLMEDPGLVRIEGNLPWDVGIGRAEEDRLLNRVASDDDFLAD